MPVLIASILSAFFGALGFAEDPAEAVEVPITVFVDGSSRGNVNAVIQGEFIGFDRKGLLSMLMPLIDETVIAGLSSGDTESSPSLSDSLGSSLSTGLIEAEDLSSLGIDADFNASLLELSLTIPPSLRRVSSVYISEPRDAFPGLVEEPSFFSAYLTLQTRGDILWQYLDTGESETSFPLTALVQPMMNISSFVTEAELLIESYPEFSATLNYLRMVKDFPSRSLRLTGGSLLFPAGAVFLPSYPVAGFGISRDPSLSFSQRSGISSSREIFLMNPAIVTVYMNGSVVKTMRLPPGRHSIEDFPFLSGLNSLSIEIREEGSPVRIEHFSVSFDANLLPRGETAFFAGVAVPQWDTEPLLLLGFFRFGAAETLTLGIHAESSLDSGIYGLEAIWASPLGNLKAEGGFRFDPEVFDYGYQLQYRFSLAGRTRLPVIALGARYDGAEYAGPGTADAVNPYAWQINAVASKSFGTAFGMNLGAVYKVGRERSDTLSFSLGLNKSFGLGVSLNFSAEAVTRDEGGFGYRGSVSLLAAPPAKREVLSLNQDLVGGDSSIDFQVRPKTSIGSAGYSFSLGGLPYGAGYPAYLRGGIQYSGRYFEGSFSDTFSQDPEGDLRMRNTLSANFSSSFAVADGIAGISRPIRDGFALIIPGETLADHTVLVRSYEDSMTLSARRGAAAVIPDLRGYSLRRISLDAQDLPLEREAERRERVFAPAYKTGYALRIDSSVRIFGDGRIIYPDNEPLALQAGTISSLDSPDDEVFFFTDEEGVFQYFDRKPGSYRLVLLSHPEAPHLLTIPAAEGFHSLGTIILPALKKE